MATECIVIGAGISGLAAAAHLASRGRKVLILEARDRIGGRIHTLTEGLPCPVDAGASFVHGRYRNPLTKLAEDNNIAISYGMEHEGGATYTGSGPALPSELSQKLCVRSFETVFETTRVSAQSFDDPPLSNSLASGIYAADSALFQDLSREEVDIVRDLTSFFESWTGAAFEEVSLRWWGFERETSGPDGVVIDGYRGFLTVFDDVIRSNSGQIELNREVIGLKLDDERDRILVSHRDSSSSQPADTSANFATSAAPFVICTLPLGVMQDLPTDFFDPPLPRRRQQSLRRLGFGLLNKIILSYPFVFWPEHSAWIELLPSSEDIEAQDPILGKVIGIQNYLPITGKAVLVIFAGGPSGASLEREEPAKLESRLRRKFTRHFFCGTDKEAPQAEKCIITKWGSDKWSKGSYSYFPVAEEGQEADAATPLDMIELSRPLWNDRLGFAGEATEPDLYASVHGPLVTGRLEGERVHVELSQE